MTQVAIAKIMGSNMLKSPSHGTKLRDKLRELWGIVERNDFKALMPQEWSAAIEEVQWNVAAVIV